MASALAHIPSNLRTFIEPQIEQLGAVVKQGRFGYDCPLPGDSPVASGFVWVASLGTDCLVSAHEVVPRADFRMVEYPTEYGCLCALSAASLNQTPVERPRLVQPDENLVAFFQAEGEFPTTLERGRSYTSRSLIFTPAFFERLRSRDPGDFDTLAEDMATLGVNEFPDELRALVRQIGPRRASLPGAELYFRAKVLEAASLVVAYIDETKHARSGRGSTGQRGLVADARAYIEDRLGEPLPIAQVAAACYAGRTRLCAAFREEQGVPLGTYIRQRRMRRACELLVGTTLDVAQVARAVGYSNPGSFSETFAREMGAAPTAWRAGTGA